jgi:hypothetical protein
MSVNECTQRKDVRAVFFTLFVKMSQKRQGELGAGGSHLSF